MGGHAVPPGMRDRLCKDQRWLDRFETPGGRDGIASSIGARAKERQQFLGGNDQ